MTQDLTIKLYHDPEKKPSWEVANIEKVPATIKEITVEDLPLDLTDPNPQPYHKITFSYETDDDRKFQREYPADLDRFNKDEVFYIELKNFLGHDFEELDLNSLVDLRCILTIVTMSNSSETPPLVNVVVGQMSQYTAEEEIQHISRPQYRVMTTTLEKATLKKNA